MQENIKAALVAIVNDEEDQLSFNELKELTENVGASIDILIPQKRRTPDKNTYIGSGKLEEIKQYIEQNSISLVVFDAYLSPSCHKNIEDILQVKILDRTGIILQIFADRAKSSEGKAQVELAQLKYLLPRLRGKGEELSRLAGGIGTRGPGESKLETDRRHILSRITSLKKQLENIAKNREQLRRRREKNNIPIVSIAGYTNAGKSTLLNYLTNANVLSEDKLFATLDSTTRKFVLPSGKEILLSDTVGFIRNLPHELIYAFKSTFEEIVLSDIVLLTVDFSSDDFENQLNVVRSTLQEIGFSGRVIMVYNKIDCVDSKKILFFPSSDCVYLSAKNGQGMDKLIEILDNELSDMKLYNLKINYENVSIYYLLKGKGRIVKEDFLDDEITFTCNLNQNETNMYSKYIF